MRFSADTSTIEMWFAADTRYIIAFEALAFSDIGIVWVDFICTEKRNMQYPKIPKNWSEWNITEKIGEGSFGNVYRIERSIGGRKDYSAVKIIQIPDERISTDYSICGASSEETEAFYRELVEECIREIEMMKTFRGITNIVSIEDYVLEQVSQEPVRWNIFIRMELLTSFPEYLQMHEMTEADVLALGIDICNALEYCWQKNIVHRDIKPGNIFVSDFNNYKLGDFGIARSLEQTRAAYSIKGTNGYMAPEVYLGKPYGAQADIYSLGIVMYQQMNRGRDPFVDVQKQLVYSRDRETAFARRISGEPVPAPAGGSEDLKQIILKACAYDPEDRYATPSEMKHALEILKEKKSVEDTADQEKRTSDSIAPHSEKTTGTLDIKETEQADGTGRKLLIGLLAGIVLVAVAFTSKQLSPMFYQKYETMSESDAVQRTSEEKSEMTSSESERRLSEETSVSEAMIKMNNEALLGVQGPHWKISGAKELNVREGPSRYEEIIGTVDTEDILVGTGESSEINGASWVEILFPDENSTGWVSASYLTKEETGSDEKDDCRDTPEQDSEAEVSSKEMSDISARNQAVYDEYRTLIESELESFVANDLNTVSLSVGEEYKDSLAEVWNDNGSMRFYSEDESVAIVSDGGKITAVGKGESRIVQIDSMFEMTRTIQITGN